METEVRRLLPADAVPYRDLRLRGLQDHPDAFTSSFEEEAAKPLGWSAQRLAAHAERPHDFFLGAFRGAELAGAVGLVGRYRPKERHNATVVGMVVGPAYHGHGVGLALMRALIRHAGDCPGLEQLDLTVTAGNEAAQRIYARCGFVVYGTLQRAIRVQEHYYAKVHMALDLRQP